MHAVKNMEWLYIVGVTVEKSFSKKKKTKRFAETVLLFIWETNQRYMYCPKLRACQQIAFDF